MIFEENQKAYCLKFLKAHPSILDCIRLNRLYIHSYSTLAELFDFIRRSNMCNIYIKYIHFKFYIIYLRI